MPSREWSRSIGEPGDLADIIVALFSVAKRDFHIQKVSRENLYEIFSVLQDEFPGSLPKMIFTRTGEYLYSKTFSGALERALRLGVDPLNPRFCYFGIKDDADADKNLLLIRERTEKDFMEKMQPIAARFAEMAKAVPAQS